MLLGIIVLVGMIMIKNDWLIVDLNILCIYVPYNTYIFISLVFFFVFVSSLKFAIRLGHPSAP